MSGIIIDSFTAFPNVNSDAIDAIPNLVVRLDATTITDGTNFITTHGAPVVNWKNKVNNAIIGAEQLNTARQPKISIVSGKTEIQFDGNDYLALTDNALIDFQPNSEFSIFILTGSNTLVSGTLIEKGDSNNRQYGLMWFYNSGQNITSFLYSGQYQGFSGGLLQSPQIVAMITDVDNSFTQRVDGGTYTGTNASPTTPFSGYKALIGGRDGVGTSESNVGYFLTGAIRMVLIFNRKLSVDEINTVETTLTLYK